MTIIKQFISICASLFSVLKINIRILLKCILDFKISTLNYFKFFIKLAQPKLILTAFDYHPIFYKLSKISKAKTLMLQKGKRTRSDRIFNNKSFLVIKSGHRVLFLF